MTAPALVDLLCVLCCSTFASGALKPGAQCGTTSEKQPTGCVGKVVAIEPREPRKAKHERRQRLSPSRSDVDTSEAAAQETPR
jgi:hypothetical protein